MPEHGELEAIWIKRAHKGPMDAVDRAQLVRDRGLEGNADQGGRRQVTLIEREVFERLKTELPSVEPVMRRADLLVSGVALAETREEILRVGEARIHIQGETRPCSRMDEACQGLREALSPEWRGGVYGVVLDDGEIVVGDTVRWAE